MSDTSFSQIVDITEYGASCPTYTWRKGGTEDQSDNHFYLILGSAHDLVVKEDNVLIEVDPDTKYVKFWGKTQLLDNISFDDDTLDAKCLVAETITSDKLEQNIVINGSIDKLTTQRSINGVLFDGSQNISNFVVCNSGINTIKKSATNENFALVEGAFVTVLFKNGNSAANPSLNVNNTGNIALYYRGEPVSTTFIEKNSIHTFVYDGSKYEYVGSGSDEYLTKEDAKDTYVSIGGDTMTGILYLPPVADETNLQAATVGYVDSSLSDLNGGDY